MCWFTRTKCQETFCNRIALFQTKLVPNSGVCPEPGGVSFSSRVKYNGPYNPGDQVTHTCYDGTRGTITCQSNRAWTMKPTCSGEISLRDKALAVRCHPVKNPGSCWFTKCNDLLWVCCNIVLIHHNKESTFGQICLKFFLARIGSPFSANIMFFQIHHQQL